MLPLAVAPLAAKAIGFLTSPRVLVVVLIVSVTTSGWALAWGRGKRIDSLRANVAAAQARAAEFESAYERLAGVVRDCDRATVAMEAAARKAQAEAAQAAAKARVVARTYQEQAEALRRASAPPERSCEAAASLIRGGLKP